MLIHSPDADPLVVNTCMVMSDDDELSRTNVSCASSLSSCIVYVNELKLTV